LTAQITAAADPYLATKLSLTGWLEQAQPHILAAEMEDALLAATPWSSGRTFGVLMSPTL